MSKSPLPFEIGVEIDSKETLGEVDKTGNTATNSAGLQENEEDIVTQRNGFSDSNACDAEASEQDVSGIQRDGDQNRTHILGRVGLTILIFYNVSGGPFGIEPTVRAGGNFFAILGFVIFPFIWSIPEAMMTAELGSAFPEASGGVAWVEEAFGTTAGWMMGYLSWISGATDNAIYPVLFLDYLLEVVDIQDELTSTVRFVTLSGMAILLAYINWLGLPVIGNISFVICLAAMSPFILLTLIGMFKVDPSRWLELPEQHRNLEDYGVDDDHDASAAITTGDEYHGPVIFGIMLRPYLNNLFWNLNSWDAAACYAGDLANPGSDLPISTYWSLALVILGYLLPLLIAVGASDANQTDWVDGYLARACSDIVGPWLGTWTVFAAGISNIALFQAELSSDAFQLMGMADRAYLPRIFSTRSRHGTPTYGIILGTAVIVAMSVSNLDQLIEMLNFNYSVSLLMEYAAFLKLRVSRPDLQRPFQIPLGTVGCAIALILPVGFTVLVLFLADLRTIVFALATTGFGSFLYFLMDRDNIRGKLRCRGLCRKIRYAPIHADSMGSTPASEVV